MTEIYGIVADPVSHSLSPPMQQAAFDFFHHDALFKRFHIFPPDLPYFLQRVRREKIRGLAVSLPHKETIIPLLDHISEKAQKIGAVNTVFWKEEKLCGDNTDEMGFWKAIAPHSKKIQKVAIVGAGGAARAMVFALRSRGIAVTIFNRTPEKAEKLAIDFDADFSLLSSFCASEFDLVANATSVGLKSDFSPVSPSSWGGFFGIAFDAIFYPLYTRFLRDAEMAGARAVVTGEKMLLFQGMAQFEIWTGFKAPKAVMKKSISITETA